MPAINTPDAPTIKSLIESDAPVSQWMPLFSSAKEAATQFANVHGKRFALTAAKGKCCMCNGGESSAVVKYNWEARFFRGVGFGVLSTLLLLLGRIHVQINSDAISFQTFHPLCRKCASRLRINRLVAGVLYALGLALMILSLLFGGVFWGMVFTARLPKDRDAALTLAIMGTVGFIAGLLCVLPVRRLRLPKSLEYLGKRPFFYSSSAVVTELQPRRRSVGYEADAKHGES